MRAEVTQWLADRRQRRVHYPAGVDVVIPGQRHVRGHPDACPLEFQQHADCHLVVGARDRLGEPAAAEHHPGGRDPACLGEVAVDDLLKHAAGRGERDLLEGGPPFGGVGGVAGAGDQAQPAVPVVAGEVRGEGGHARRVVAEHHVQSGLVPAAGDEDDRNPPGQGAEFPGGHDLLGDEQPVDLARQRAHATFKPFALGVQREQQRPFGAAQDRLGRVHDLVGEQQAASLDVHLVRAAFQGHQADDVLPAAGESPRRGIGDEVERLDHGEHTLARVLAHQVRSAQHPGDGGRGNPGHACHIINGSH